MTSRIDYNNPQGAGSLSLSYHYEMLSDARRIEPFLRAIQRVCNGKIVLESGTGTGILSILAARAGAKHVYAVEIDPKMADVAAENIQRSGYSSIITLLRKSTLDVTPDDLRSTRAEVVIAENLSTWQVTEPQNQVMNHITGILAGPDAIRLPEQVDNYVELVEARFRFYDTIELKAHYFQFTGISEPELRSSRGLYSTFDYSSLVPTAFDSSISLVATSSGVVNAVRLTSPIKVYDSVRFHSSDSLMPPVIVPLDHEINVEPGQELLLRIRYSTNTSWETFTCDVSLDGDSATRTSSMMQASL